MKATGVLIFTLVLMAIATFTVAAPAADPDVDVEVDDEAFTTEEKRFIKDTFIKIKEGIKKALNTLKNKIGQLLGANINIVAAAKNLKAIVGGADEDKCNEACVNLSSTSLAKVFGEGVSDKVHKACKYLCAYIAEKRG